MTVQTTQKRPRKPVAPLEGSGAWFNGQETHPEWHESDPALQEERQSLDSLSTHSSMDEEDEEVESLPVDPSRHKLWYYSSNHVLVNRERTRRKIAPVIRNRDMDDIAREHAEFMASIEDVRHEDALKLQSKLAHHLGPCVGSNVAKGENIRTIHKSMMKESVSASNNILNVDFKYMGMGTATGPSGDLYICQIFK